MAVISSGRVVGQFAVGIVDGPDAGDEPDIVPAGGTVEFVGAIPYIPVVDAIPNPLTVMTMTITGILDASGYLCTPDTANPLIAGARGIRLFASDAAESSVQGWSWTVTYKFNPVNNSTPSIPSHPIVLMSGQTLDLTEFVRVPSSPGLGTEQAVSLVARAEDAAAIALQVKANADAGLFLGDKLAMGTLTQVAAGGSATATVTGTSPNKLLNLGLVRGDPGGFVSGTVLPNNTNLNTIKTAGMYQFNNLSGGVNFPPLLTQLYGNVMVYNSDSGTRVNQVVIPTATQQASRVQFTRYSTDGGVNWTTFQASVGTRTDKTAGIAIYQWDEISNREQRTYGDTGIRDISADILAASGVTPSLARIRRVNSLVSVELILPISTPTGTIQLGTFVVGFRGATGVGQSRITGQRNATPNIMTIGSTGSAAVAGNTPNTGELNVYGSYMTTDPWPTTLPGVAVGTIPNT